MTEEEQDIMDHDVDILKKHVAQLMEHFDTVQIFCTRHSPELDGTVRVQWGGGNYYARYGQVNRWIIEEENNND